MEDTSGFYKEIEGVWYFAQDFVNAKEYTLERDGNNKSIDGWIWYDSAPFEYLNFLNTINQIEIN